MERDSVPHKVDCLFVEANGSIQLAHLHRVEIVASPCCLVLQIDTFDVDEEISAVLFLDKTHERRPDGLRLICRHLGDFVASIHN